MMNDTMTYGSVDNGESFMVKITDIDDIGLNATIERETILHRTRASDLLFSFLGFHANPFSTTGPQTGTNHAAADIRLSILSNFSTAYNVISISLSLHLMNQVYSVSSRDKSLCSSALIAGMIVGQLCGGMIGDVLGRHRGMSLVMFLQVFSAITSGFSAPFRIPIFKMNLSIFDVLALHRFVLGIGCGGVYPLAATLTAESSQSSLDRGKAVALTFSFQGLAYLVVPIITWAIVGIYGEANDLSWRLVLWFGALPGVSLAILRFLSIQKYKMGLAGQVDDTTLRLSSSRQMRSVPVSVFDAILLENDLIRKFAGTGGCWLLFDILFYGNVLFQPVVLSSAFGKAETVRKVARDSTIIAMLALPGYYVSVFAVGRQSPRFIQILGFSCMGMTYLVIGTLFRELSGNRSALLLIYGLTFFFSNYGPNATTFMLPSMTYSRACRSTLNGVCAASGKVGALIGALVFVQASNLFGAEVVFMACGLLSFVGSFITMICVSPLVGRDDPDDMNVQMLDEPARQQFEQRYSLLRMKPVFSHPSLVDYHE